MTNYIGICVRKSGHAAVTKPSTDLNEVTREMKEYVLKHWGDIAFTTFITRSADKPITLAEVFGHPRSRDLMQSRKFISEVTDDRRKQ